MTPKPKLALQVLAALLPLSLSGVIYTRGQATRATAELKAALEHNDYTSVRRLAPLASDVDVLPDFCGATALQLAVAQDDVATAKLLIERGADVNLSGPSEARRRPLDEAVWNASPGAVRLLLAHRASVRASTMGTARHCASYAPRDPSSCGASNTLCDSRLILEQVQGAWREQQVLAGRSL